MVTYYCSVQKFPKHAELPNSRRFLADFQISNLGKIFQKTYTEFCIMALN